jgi:hypothetical protein
MSKQVLFEVNALAKLLSFFYDQKAKGTSDDVMQSVVKKSNKKEVERAYNAWKKSNEELLLATRELCIKADLDTSKVDALLKKYHNY